MIEHLIKEINSCLKNDCQIAALTMALTLPDSCGKVCYPNSKNRERYIQWYDNYITEPQKKFDMNPIVNGEIVYELRCALLHESNPVIHGKSEKIDKFSLIWRSINSSARTPVEKYTAVDKEGNRQECFLSIDIVSLCMDICEAALIYYRENKEKFSFQYRIISTSDQVANAFKIDNKMNL